ncbi:MAG: LysM peptidoglycan-binding domain-containing protein, partial [Anaerolineae bacterium]|nr:LysM peptidoglycan-binding domain-containing protein [Anaerolineae bacterium]
PSADRLPGPGSTILIPLPTVAPTLPADVQTATALSGIPQVSLAIETTIVPHVVREGETILGIAEQYRTTLRVLRDLNPRIGFFNCDLTNPSGGPDCRVILETGEAVNVPAPTPTPTLSPTPSGNETATPTPTFAAPRVSFPPRDAVINAAATFTLQWVSVGVLEAQQVYLVQIENLATGTAFNDITRATSYRLPSDVAPTGGERQQYRWRVSVALQNADGRYGVVGAEGEWRTFSWGTGE